MSVSKMLLNIWRRRKNNSGAAAVEFALLIGPLVGLILASIQLGMIFLFGQELQSVTEKAGRQLMTGTAQTANLTQAQFVAQVCAILPVPFQCSNIMVDVESASSFTTISTAPLTLTYNAAGAVTNTWNYSPGNPGDIVVVRVMYNWPVVGGMLAPGLSNQPNGASLMVGTAVFKNEPY